jgi:hypothetical protein
VDYAVTFDKLMSAAGTVAFSVPAAVHFVFEFDTGEIETSPGTFTITWDSSAFDQAAVEAAIASTLDGVCTLVADLLGLSTDTVKAAVIVRRMMTWNQNGYSVIPGVSSGPQQVIIPDVMPYAPQLVSSSDAGSAVDGSEHVATG